MLKKVHCRIFVLTLEIFSQVFRLKCIYKFAMLLQRYVLAFVCVNQNVYLLNALSYHVVVPSVFHSKKLYAEVKLENSLA